MYMKYLHNILHTREMVLCMWRRMSQGFLFNVTGIWYILIHHCTVTTAQTRCIIG